jgi:hypothetical protein
LDEDADGVQNMVIESDCTGEYSIQLKSNSLKKVSNSSGERQHSGLDHWGKERFKHGVLLTVLCFEMGWVCLGVNLNAEKQCRTYFKRECYDYDEMRRVIMSDLRVNGWEWVGVF